MKKLKKENKGFSLAELIVVVLILGILAVAVTPQIMNWVNKSKIGKDESYAGGVATAVESVALEYLAKTGSLDDAEYELTEDGVTGDENGDETLENGTVVKGLAGEIETMVGNLQNPEQKDKSKYKIVLDYIDSTGTVKVTVTAE